MTLEEFADVFALLAIQLRFTDADEATIRAYYEPMKHCAIETVRLAAERFAREPGANAGWFPKTPEWLAMIGAIRYERSQALSQALRRLPEPLCRACGDTGMARDESTNRVSRCTCHALRELEIAGVRPLPALLPARPPMAENVKRITGMVGQLAGRSTQAHRE